MIEAMYWLVKDAQPHDSLFFQCEYPKYVTTFLDLMNDRKQTLDMVDRRKIWMETRLMVWMKVLASC